MGYNFRYQYKLGEFETEIEMNLYPGERERVARYIVEAIRRDFRESPKEEKPEE